MNYKRIIEKKPPYPYDEKTEIIRIPKKLEEELKHLTRNRKKIEAMKKVVELTGASLRVCKDYVNSLLTIF